MAAHTRKLEAGPQLDDTLGRYFASLAVRDVRCFGPVQHLSLLAGDRPARWTLLLGENGVGKTTLLQALALTSIEHPHEMLESWDYEYEREERQLPLFGRGGERPRDGSITAVTTLKRKKQEHGFKVTGDPYGPWLPNNEPARLFLCAYGASRRLGGGRLRRREGRTPVGSLFVNAPLLDAEEWLLQADYAAVRNSDDPRARLERERVRDLLLRVLPETSDLRIGSSKRRGLPSVELQTQYGWVPLRALSLGYQTLIAWMVDLASRFFQRFPESTDPFSEAAIVLVDEIDLHLHPKWQRALIGYLTTLFPNTQFIATAHSPLVVQAAEGANIVVLRRERDHVVIDCQPDEVRNWRIDQILTSDLYGLPSARPPRLDALIAERRAILTKPEVSAVDRKRLRTLEKRIGTLPGGESPPEIRATELIMRAAKELGGKAKGKKR